MRKVILSIYIFVLALAVKAQVPVVLVAGQSKTDGRVDNAELPEYI